MKSPIFGFLTKDGQIGNRPVTAFTMLRRQTWILELRAGFAAELLLYDGRTILLNAFIS
jgi:hypothetical protein